MHTHISYVKSWTSTSNLIKAKVACRPNPHMKPLGINPYGTKGSMYNLYTHLYTSRIEGKVHTETMIWPH